MESGPLLFNKCNPPTLNSVISRFELNCSVNVAHACSQWCHSTLRFNTIYRFFMETVKCTIVVGGVWSNGHLRRTIELSFWAYAIAQTDHKLPKWNFWWHFQHVFFRLLKNTVYKFWSSEETVVPNPSCVKDKVCLYCSYVKSSMQRLKLTVVVRLLLAYFRSSSLDIQRGHA